MKSVCNQERFSSVQYVCSSYGWVRRRNGSTPDCHERTEVSFSEKANSLRKLYIFLSVLKCKRFTQTSKRNICIHVRLCQLGIRLPTLVLKPRGDVTRGPKQGYQWPHKKDLCPSKLKKKHLHSRNKYCQVVNERQYNESLIDLFRARKIPIIIRRYLPDGSYEDWGIDELIITE